MSKLNYYTITEAGHGNNEYTFNIEINPDCKVFQGHFPGEPICPGVCNIQMLKECAEKALGKKMILSSIKQCKLTALMKPDTDKNATVKLSFENKNEPVKFTAELYNNNKTFIIMKGELTYGEVKS